MSIAKRGGSYFISAGEQSGELLAADFVLALRALTPNLKPVGIVGDAMRGAGVSELANIDELSVMGIGAVAKEMARLRILESKILQRIDEIKPRFALLVDFPGFHLRLAEQLKLRGIPVFQYVAPKVWAWGASRVAALRENFDMVLGILPFEETFFRENGVPYRYVGSPQKDRTDKVVIKKESLGFERSVPLVALLPGSRCAELEKILPVMLQVKRKLTASLKDVQFVLPLATNLDFSDLQPCLMPGQNLEVHGSTADLDGIKVVRGMSLEAMAAADVAFVASGTATLECALLGTPMTVVYVMGETTYAIAKKIVKLTNFSLVNLMTAEPVVKEYIQEFSIDDVTKELQSLLVDQQKRAVQVRAFDQLRAGLSGNAASVAARVVADAVARM